MSEQTPHPKTAPESDHPESSAAGLLSDFCQLTKARLSALSVFTVLLGFAAARPSGDPAILLPLAGGALLTAFAASVLNQWSERKIDRLMNRTRDRPLATGRLSPAQGLFTGALLATTGLWILTFHVNLLSAALAALTIILYWLVYTPLKRLTPWCTEVGAAAGAIPPLIGWSAATGSLDMEAWILFGILFCWQITHFHPIAWRYREDYARIPLRMRTVIEPTGNQAANHAVIYAILLFPISAAPVLTGTNGLLYLFGACLLGGIFLHLAVRFRTARDRTRSALTLFHFSLLHLPALLSLLVLDRWLP